MQEPVFEKCFGADLHHHPSKWGMKHSAPAPSLCHHPPCRAWDQHSDQGQMSTRVTQARGAVAAFAGEMERPELEAAAAAALKEYQEPPQEPPLRKQSLASGVNEKHFRAAIHAWCVFLGFICTCLALLHKPNMVTAGHTSWSSHTGQLFWTQTHRTPRVLPALSPFPTRTRKVSGDAPDCKSHEQEGTARAAPQQWC